MPASFVPPPVQNQAPGGDSHLHRVPRGMRVPVAGGPCVPPGASSAERCWARLELCLQASSLLPPSVAAELTAA